MTNSNRTPLAASRPWAPRWLLARLARKSRSRTERFESGANIGRAELAASTAIQPFLTEVSSYPGVHTAHATLDGTDDDPVLALVVTAKQDGDPYAINDRIEDEGLPRLRQALDLDPRRVTVEFRFSPQTGVRTV